MNSALLRGFLNATCPTKKTRRKTPAGLFVTMRIRGLFRAGRSFLRLYRTLVLLAVLLPEEVERRLQLLVLRFIDTELLAVGSRYDLQVPHEGFHLIRFFAR